MKSIEEKWKSLKLGSVLEKIAFEGWFTEKLGDKFEVIDIDKNSKTYIVRKLDEEKKVIHKRKGDLYSFDFVQNVDSNKISNSYIIRIIICLSFFILGITLGVIFNMI